jgi:hypothetical protein
MIVVNRFALHLSFSAAPLLRRLTEETRMLIGSKQSLPEKNLVSGSVVTQHLEMKTTNHAPQAL